jgi:ribonuclease P protein component, eubacterial
VKYKAISENHLYGKAYARGKKVVGRYTVVYILPDYTANKLMKAHPLKLKVNRIGLTVTKKIGNACVRSRVKRIIREAYRLTDRNYGIRTGYLIVIVARAAAVEMKTGDIESDLVKAFDKFGLINVKTKND